MSSSGSKAFSGSSRKAQVSKALQAKMNAAYLAAADALAPLIETSMCLGAPAVAAAATDVPIGHGMSSCQKCHYKCVLAAPACERACEARCERSDYCYSCPQSCKSAYEECQALCPLC
jgi:hypothetical protein